MENEILEEVWRNRDEFARKYSCDIDAMVAALQEIERHRHTRIADRRKDKRDEDTPPPERGE